MQDTTLRFKVKSGKLELKDDCKTVINIEFDEEWPCGDIAADALSSCDGIEIAE